MLATAKSLAASLSAALGGGEIIGPAQPGEIPRFAVYHAANSICSQKVRVVLAQHQFSYSSHPLNIFAGETYLPDYVRLRLIGCERAGLSLVATHTGSTSTSAGGCDPAVVPTLVDRHADEVIIDSKLICLYLDSLVPACPRLRPLSMQTVIDAELDIVDNLPNYQMLAGRPIGADRRPQKLRESDGVSFSMSKVKRCDQYLVEFACDDVLVGAYQAKRSKELMAAERLFSEEAMKSAYSHAYAACALLNKKLETSRSTWLTGSAVSLADLFWAVELLRMKNLGAAHIWEQNRLPAVQRFVAAAESLESVRSAVLEWPGSQFWAAFNAADDRKQRAQNVRAAFSRRDL
jgi:2,5-dichlorohydroquinone reductive dechlorinase